MRSESAETAAATEGVVVHNGEMRVHIGCDLAEAGDLWCIHRDLDWPRVLREGITRTLQTHLPRGVALRVVVDVGVKKSGR